MCRVLQLPRSTYYYESKAVETVDEIIPKIIEIFKSFHDITVFPQRKKIENQIGIVPVHFRNHTPTEISKILDENFDIAVRGGLHCSPETHKFLDTHPQGLIRFSLGYFNTENDLIKLREALESFCI